MLHAAQMIMIYFVNIVIAPIIMFIITMIITIIMIVIVIKTVNLLALIS